MSHNDNNNTNRTDMDDTSLFSFLPLELDDEKTPFIQPSIDESSDRLNAMMESSDIKEEELIHSDDDRSHRVLYQPAVEHSEFDSQFRDYSLDEDVFDLRTIYAKESICDAQEFQRQLREYRNEYRNHRDFWPSKRWNPHGLTVDSSSIPIEWIDRHITDRSNDSSSLSSFHSSQSSCINSDSMSSSMISTSSAALSSSSSPPSSSSFSSSTQSSSHLASDKLDLNEALSRITDLTQIINGEFEAIVRRRTKLEILLDSWNLEAWRLKNSDYDWDRLIHLRNQMHEMRQFRECSILSDKVGYWPKDLPFASFSHRLGTLRPGSLALNTEDMIILDDLTHHHSFRRNASIEESSESSHSTMAFSVDLPSLHRYARASANLECLERCLRFGRFPCEKGRPHMKPAFPQFSDSFEFQNLMKNAELRTVHSLIDLSDSEDSLHHSAQESGNDDHQSEVDILAAHYHHHHHHRRGLPVSSVSNSFTYDYLSERFRFQALDTRPLLFQNDMILRRGMDVIGIGNNGNGNRNGDENESMMGHFRRILRSTINRKKYFHLKMSEDENEEKQKEKEQQECAQDSTVDEEGLVDYILWDDSDYLFRRGRTMDNDTVWDLDNPEHKAWAAQRWTLRIGRVSDPQFGPLNQDFNTHHSSSQSTTINEESTIIIKKEMGCQTDLTQDGGPLLYSLPISHLTKRFKFGGGSRIVIYEHAFDDLLVEHMKKEELKNHFLKSSSSSRMRMMMMRLISRGTQTLVNRRLYLDCYFNPTCSALSSLSYMKSISHDLHFDYLSLSDGYFGRRLPFVFPELSNLDLKKSLLEMTKRLSDYRRSICDQYLIATFKSGMHIPDFFAASLLLSTSMVCRSGFQSAICSRYPGFSTIIFSDILAFLTGFPRRRALAVCRALQFDSFSLDFCDRFHSDPAEKEAVVRAPFHRSRMRFVMRFRTMMHSVDFSERHSNEPLRALKAQTMDLDAFRAEVLGPRVRKAELRASKRRRLSVQSASSLG